MHVGNVDLGLALCHKRPPRSEREGINAIGQIHCLLGAQLNFFNVTQVDDLGKTWTESRIGTEIQSIVFDVIEGHSPGELHEDEPILEVDGISGGERPPSGRIGLEAAPTFRAPIVCFGGFGIRSAHDAPQHPAWGGATIYRDGAG